MSEFDKAEAEDKFYFNQLYPNYIKDYSRDNFSWWDVSGYTVSPDLFDNTSVPYVAELKKRNCKSDRYATALLQADKYESLMNYTLSSGIVTFYICFYLDKTLIFNVSKIDANSRVNDPWILPVNSVVNNGDKIKEVYLLPLSTAKVINRGTILLSKEKGK